MIITPHDFHCITGLQFNGVSISQKDELSIQLSVELLGRCLLDDQLYRSSSKLHASSIGDGRGVYLDGLGLSAVLVRGILVHQWSVDGVLEVVGPFSGL